MQGYVDEIENLRNEEDAQREDDENGESKEQILKFLKTRLFSLFFRLNTMKIAIPIHYHIIMIAIEGFQLLTLVLGDGTYSSLGPYETSSPWNLDQTQWLIDICWVFRIDRYLRGSYIQFVTLCCVFSFLIASTIALGVLLAWKIRNFSGVFSFVTKILKLLITVLTNLLYIPVLDTFAFGIKCSIGTSTECLELPEGYQFMALYMLVSAMFFGIILLSALLYYDLCMICGGTMAKPHARFKVLRLVSYALIIFSYYFITTNGKIILYLIICLLAGIVLCFVYSQYIPYYNTRICNIRLGVVVTFTSASFCMLVGEFFKSTDQTNSSITMLYYFLTPCLVQIMQLALMKRSKAVAEKTIQQLTNPYQVEMKARMLVLKLEEAKNKQNKSIFVENDEGENEEFQNLQTQTLQEIESTFYEAFKKFPNSELLYLWSGLLQLHIFENYILALVQCFKGIMIANKLDSQYALYHFRRTSESFYKAHMKDDAYDYELFQKARASAQKNDEAVTRSQFYFWAELESRSPKIHKLNKLAGETSTLISVTKSNYERLLKLNSKNTEALRMYGCFLASLNNFSDMGQRYLNKAEVQEEAQKKNMNANLMNSFTQPLSFFDADNAIIQVSADFETMGEILNANSTACRLLSYISAELIGRNISLIIPSPFNENHDEYMKKLHETGNYAIVDQQNLVLYFADKNSFIFEARLLVKVVPNDGHPPFLSAIIKPTYSNYEVILMNSDWIITGISKTCAELFDYSNNKNSEQKIVNLIPTFDELKTKMKEDSGANINHENDRYSLSLNLKLLEINIGEHTANLVKITVQEKKDKGGVGFDMGGNNYTKEDTEDEIRPVSTVMPNEQEVAHTDINLELESESSDEKKQAGSDESEGSEDESEEEEDSEESEEAKTVTEESEEDDISGSAKELSESKKEKFAGVNVPEGEDETSLPQNYSKEKGSSGKKEDSEEGDELLDDFEAESQENQSDSDSENSSNESQESEKSSDQSLEEEENDEEDENDGQSAYNSSKSMNSSMASLAQFNKSIKALVSFEFSKTKKYVMRFKITLLLTIVVLIVTSVVTFEIIENSVTLNEELSHYVNLVGNMRLYAQSMSYYSRMISLMDSGIIPPQERPTYFDWMGKDIDDMHEINLRLYKNYELLSEEDQAVYIDENIQTWLLEGGNVRGNKANLFDATSNFILQGFLLKEEYQDQSINLANRRAFYLFRNGNGETLQYLNTSASFYVQTAISDLENEKYTALMLIFVSVFLLSFCAGFAIIPAIRTLEKSKREVWEIFFEIPAYVCRFMKAKCSDRLNILNENQMDLEEQQQEEAGLDEEKPDKKDASKSKDENTKKKRKNNDAKKVLPYDPRQRKVIIGKLLCFFVISIVYFYLIYYTGFEAIGDVLKEEPVHVNWASRRRQLSRGINMWVTETLFENVTDVGWKYVVPSKQNIGSPLHQASKFINELDYVENSLIFGDEEAGVTFSEIRSEEHDNILFENACNVPVDRSKSDCETVGDKAMLQGLHSALGMYTTLARSLLLKIQNMSSNRTLTLDEIKNFFMTEDMVLLRDFDNHYLYDPLTKSSSLYEDDYSAHQDEMKIWQNLLMSLYCVFSLLFFFFVYSPMINRIGMDTKNAWSMCTLIPQEYQEDFKKLNAAIKDRRDNFKWR